MSRPNDRTHRVPHPRLVSRRRLLQGMLGAGAAIPLTALLVACGGGDDDEPAASDETTDETPAEDAGSTPTERTAPAATTDAQTDASVTSEPDAATGEAVPVYQPWIEVLEETDEYRTVRHLMGETQIPAEPQRIALVGGYSWPSHLLALGIKPHAIITQIGTEIPAFYGDNLEGVIPLGPGHELNLEAVLAAEPDLIIGSEAWNAENYEQLAEIAPTIVIPNAFRETIRDEQKDPHYWQYAFRLFADLLGKEAEIQQALDEYDAKISAAREQLDQTVGDETVMFLLVQEKEYRIYGFGLAAGILHFDLDLAPPADGPLDNYLQQFNATISLEVLPEFNPDHIFLEVREGEAAQQQAEDLQASPLWQTLPAVQDDQVYPVELQLWHHQSSTVRGRSLIVDDVLEALAPEMSGTPDTEDIGWTKPDYDRVDHLLEILERTEESVLVTDQYDQEVEVPADPQRVIADWDPIADLLLALDIKPAALFTFSNPDFSTVLEPMLDGVENIPALGGPNYEAVLAVQPDLIIDALTRDRAVYDRLTEIAPTMSVGLLGITHWRTALRDIAAIFGRSTQAEEVLAEYEQKLTEARDKLREAGIYGETVACIRARDKQYSLYSVGALEADDAFYPTNLTALIYDDLALAPPQMVQDIPREEIAVEISLEVLPDLGADHLFIRRENEESFQELMNHPLMETIPAVQKGNVHVHSDDEWTTGGPILNSAWLDIVVTDLLGESE